MVVGGSGPFCEGRQLRQLRHGSVFTHGPGIVQHFGNEPERSGYSSEYLCRIFKKYHGESPYQVLLHRKISAAWLPLRDGQLQVGAVGRELGYDDPLHFSRVFRKVMACVLMSD